MYNKRKRKNDMDLPHNYDKLIFLLRHKFVIPFE